MFTPFKLERYFSKYEFTTKYLMSSSDCESISVKELFAYEPQSAEQFLSTRLGYTESRGDPELREAIATNLYKNVKASQVLVHSGAQEAIYNFMCCAIDPGDSIICLTPAYQSLFSIAKDRGIKVREWKMECQLGEWTLDSAKLNSLIEKSTKALVVNFPHNPTGYIPTKQEFLEWVEFCRKHNLYLLCDEVYRGLEKTEGDRLQASVDHYEKAVTVGVLSKTYGLAGLRIGWVATRDEEILEKMAAFKDFLTICNSGPSEYLAKIAIRNHAAIAQRNREIVDSNLSSADKFFKSYERVFEWVPPRAGPVSFVGLKGISADQFCDDVRTKAQVLLLPSSVYDAGNSHVRFGFGRRNFPEALQRLEKFLQVL